MTSAQSWIQVGPYPSRRQSATTARRPTGHARVCLAAPPPASATLPVSSTRASPTVDPQRRCLAISLGSLGHLEVNRTSELRKRLDRRPSVRCSLPRDSPLFPASSGTYVARAHRVGGVPMGNYAPRGATWLPKSCSSSTHLRGRAAGDRGTVSGQGEDCRRLLSSVGVGRPRTAHRRPTPPGEWAGSCEACGLARGLSAHCRAEPSCTRLRRACVVADTKAV
jgi:hypothetical protein